MTRQDLHNLLNRPPFLIGAGLFALVAGLMGWIAIEYSVICVGAAIIGVVLHFRKARSVRPNPR